jgi:hypothetical protein
MNIQKIAILILITLSIHANANRLVNIRKNESIRPFGIRRTFEFGLGDRYYHGKPAWEYPHLWPRWKNAILENQNLWRYKDPPTWAGYYDYPYITWPNNYYLFGVPYYNETRPKFIFDTK